MKTIICAAGMGTRLGLNIPKCLTLIQEVPLIEWQLNLLKNFTRDITVVIGFKHELVIDLLKNFEVDYVINSHFASTSVVDSILLGIGNYTDEVLLVDGDVLFTSEGIKKVIDTTGDVVCIKPIISNDNPVFVTLNNGEIQKFHREKNSDCFEWAGICKINPSYMNKSYQYIYQGLEQQLPLPYLVIDSVEVDTMEDLRDAEKWITQIK